MLTALTYLSALVNIVGIVVFSKGYSDNLTRVYPGVFSLEGIIAIQIWGLAYIAATRIKSGANALYLVFAIEKFFYTGTWAYWAFKNHLRLPAMIESDFITGSFFAIYGANDLLFGLVFLYAAVSLRDANQKKSRRD